MTNGRMVQMWFGKHSRLQEEFYKNICTIKKNCHRGVQSDRVS